MKPDVARQSLSIVTLQLLLLAGVALLRAWVAPWPAEADPEHGVLAGAALQRLGEALPGSTTLATTIMLFINAFLITRIATRSMLYVSRTLIPFVIYAIASICIFATPGDVTAMTVSLLFIAASHLFVASFRRAYGFSQLLRAGILIGIMPLLIPASIVAWGVIPVAMILFRRSWRETVVCLTGLLLPLALCSYIYWWGGAEFLHVWRVIAGSLFRPYDHGVPSLPQIILSALLLALVVVSVAVFTRTTMRTRPSRIYRYFGFSALFIAAGFLLPAHGVRLYALLAAPVAMLSPMIFVRLRGAVPALIYALLLTTALVVNLLPLLTF